MLCPVCEGWLLEPVWEDEETQRGAHYLCRGCGFRMPPTKEDWFAAYVEDRFRRPGVKWWRTRRRRKRYTDPKVLKLRRRRGGGLYSP